MFYIATDTRSSIIYIAPLGKVDQPFLIEFNNRYEADNLLRKLISKQISPPLKNKTNFKLKCVIKDLIMKGEVQVFKFQP